MIFFIIGIVIIIILLSFICYLIAFYSPHKKQNDDLALFNLPALKRLEKGLKENIKKVQEIPYKDVEIKSYDGLKLHANYYHKKDGAILALCFHGYRGTPVRDFSGGIKAYLDMGYNVLLVHQRAHKESSGHTITFGIKESKDVLTWIKYILKRFGTKQKIILCGISMGASTVLLASENKLPKNVKGIVADCPFSSPKAIIKKVTEKDMHIPFFLAYPFVWLGGLIFGHFNMNGGVVKKALKNNKLKILLIHGEEDSFVPCLMSQEIADNDKNIDIETFPGADHGLSFVVDQERYERIVKEFIDRVCK